MNTFRKIRKNAKALSPVVASIILIAVTVAVSVVVAAWMGGMSIGLMGNAEQATITNIAFTVDGTDNVIVATVQNTGNAEVTITSAYVNTVAAALVDTPIAKGANADFELGPWVSGTEYTVKMTTSKGNNLVLTAIAP